MKGIPFRKIEVHKVLLNIASGAQADADAGSGTAPESIFEGIQTTANMARVNAGYNPLDPEGAGNREI